MILPSNNLLLDFICISFVSLLYLSYTIFQHKYFSYFPNLW